MLCVFLIMIMSQVDSPRSKRTRFRVAVFMVFVLVPFMIFWNFYGNALIKSEDFKTNAHSSHVYHYSLKYP